MHITVKERKEDIPNYYRGDYASIRSRLKDIHWEEILNGTMEEDYAVFLELLDFATSGCIPNRILPRKKNNGRWSIAFKE